MSEFSKFHETMRKLIKIPHSELKAKLDAERAQKIQKRKVKKPSASDHASSDKD
jgi:hypothetical protein